MKHSTKRILCLLLAFALVFSLAAGSFAGYVAPTQNNGFYYAALGDSVAAGFGMTDREDYATMDGFNAWTSYQPSNTVPESYPAVFAAQLLTELRDEKIIDDYSDFDWANLGVASFQTYDYYRSFLDPAWTGTFWANLTGGYSADADAQRSKVAAQATALRQNPDSLWNSNKATVISYVTNYYDLSGSSRATGQALLMSSFGISFKVGQEPWGRAISNLTGTARQEALKAWANTDAAKEAMLPMMVENQISRYVSNYYLFHDLFVEKLAKADMITLHIGANDLLEQFMFDLISTALVGSTDNQDAQSFGSGTNTDYLNYGIEVDNDETSPTYGQTVCTLYNPAMYITWCTLFTLMEGISESAVAAQLITMISNYQSYITQDHLTELLTFLQSDALEENLYQNGVNAMRYYDDIVKMIKVGGEFAVDPFGKTSTTEDDPYLDADKTEKNPKGWITIDAINPDADIVYIGTFNPFGTSLEYNGHTYELKDILKNIVSDIFCGLKTGELDAKSILNGVCELTGITDAEEISTLEDAFATLSASLSGMNAGNEQGQCKLNKDQWISIFGEVTRDADVENLYTTVFSNEEYNIIVNAATYELDGTAKAGGASAALGETVSGQPVLIILPVLDEVTGKYTYPLLGTAVINGEVAQVGSTVAFDEAGKVVKTEADFIAEFGEQPYWGRNSKGYSYRAWNAEHNKYTWKQVFVVPISAGTPETPTVVNLIMRSSCTTKEFAAFANTDAGKRSLLDLIATLSTGTDGQLSFTDLANEDSVNFIKGLYGVSDLSLGNSWSNMGTRSYLGLGGLEDVLSMDLIFGVLLMQAGGMDANSALETAQLLTTVMANLHYPLMFKLMGEPGLKACNYIDGYISDVAAQYGEPFVYILDMPNENNFNPHPGIQNAAWLANRIFETILMHVTVEGTANAPGMVYGPNSKRGYNVYDVLYGYTAHFDVVPDTGYRLENYSIDGGEPVVPTDETRNHIVIENITADTTLTVNYVLGDDPYAVGAPKGLIAIDTTAPGASDGKILNTNEHMEWDTDPDFTDPQKCTEGIDGLAAGTYYVRYINGNGAYAPVRINDGNGVKELLPTQVIGIATSKPGASDGKLNRTTPQMEYSTDAEFTNPIRCGSGHTDDLKADTYYVRYIGETGYVTVEVADGTEAHEVINYVDVVSTKTFTITVEKSDKGVVTASRKSASAGAAVTLEVKPENGCTLDTIKVVDAKGETYAVKPLGDTKFSFTMPAANVTVAASYIGDIVCPRDETCPIDKFTDTQNDYWWHDGIHYCLEKGLMRGAAPTAFAPNGTTSRGMIVSILWRYEGSPVVNFDLTFKDVDEEAYYAEAVRWAQANEIVSGYDEDSFAPNSAITREQMTTILLRYARYKGANVTDFLNTDLSVYSDVDYVSSWALTAMKWAVGSGLLKGYNDLLNPTATATRAEAATLMMRYCEKIG